MFRGSLNSSPEKGGELLLQEEMKGLKWVLQICLQSFTYGATVLRQDIFVLKDVARIRLCILFFSRIVMSPSASPSPRPSPGPATGRRRRDDDDDDEDDLDIDRPLPKKIRYVLIYCKVVELLIMCCRNVNPDTSRGGTFGIMGDAFVDFSSILDKGTQLCTVEPGSRDALPARFVIISRLHDPSLMSPV